MDAIKIKLKGLFFLIFWFVFSSLIAFFVFRKGQPYLTQQNVAAVCVLFAPCLILGWVAQGPMLGLILLFILSIITVFLSALAKIYSVNVILLIFVSVAFLANIFFQKNKMFLREEETKSEELQEAINTLDEEVKKEKALTDSLEKRSQKYNSLRDVTKKMDTLLSIDALADYVTQRAFDLIGRSDACLLYLIDETKQELALSSKKLSKSGSIIKSKKGDVIDTWLLKHRVPLLVGDARKDFRFNIDKAQEEKRELVSIISAPLVTENKILGILRLESQKVENYTSEDLRLLDILSDIAAVALKNSMLYQRTQELAMRDGLTGLFVYRYFRQRFKEELERASRKASPVSFIIFDIDFFKNYNDNYGHTAGDIVLKRVADILKDTAKGEESIIARYGGEEFAVVLPGCAKEKAFNIAEKMRAAIEAETFLLRRQETKVTVSAGVSAYPIDSMSDDDLIRNADSSLYMAKHSGRNRVCAA